MSSNEPHVAKIAALIGDPARANILKALMDGRARTAKELAHAAGVSPQTTSGHLARLVDGGLLAVAKQGRHRYFHLANGLVAGALESLMALAGERPVPKHHHQARIAADLRAARTCYDHLAGKLGVLLFDRMLATGCILPTGDGDDFVVSAEGRRLFAQLNIDIDGLATKTGQRRRFARACLDWSERSPHLAGALGAALAACCFQRGWLQRRRDSRAVTLTPAGVAALAGIFGLPPDQLGAPEEAARH
ncbi:helix-turn-helix transcriptional regulator [Ferrovibrio sp.]|uniref:ArsR/SmtB family transcription factor n=1 Tax=Ferrovibrio sp. TaxID=1917215 RepID=UPI00262F5550|nr:helix-turn-helix transcriptional regulator [Ferrovibrio sp.]